MAFTSTHSVHHPTGSIHPTTNVFVPVEPAHNGIVLPLLLSVLIHGLIALLVLWLHRLPDLDSTPAIQTQLISPEELSQIQGQIMANRDAAQAAALQDSSTAATSASNVQVSPDTQMQTNSNRYSQNDNYLGQGEQIFTPSHRPADIYDDNYRYDYQQKIQEQRRQYEQDMAEFASQLDAQIQAEMQAQANAQKQRNQEQIARIEAFKQAERQQDHITEKNRRELQQARQQNDNNTQAAQSTNSYDLGSDGKLQAGADRIAAGGTSSSSSRQSGGSSRSIASFKNAIVSKIQQNFHPPVESQNKTSVLTLRIGSDGSVTSATATGADSRVNDAAEKAAYAASPLPIDTSNPQAFSNIRVTIRGQ